MGRVEREVKSLHGCNAKFMLPANVNHFAMPRLQLLQPRAAQSESQPHPHPHPHPLERQTAAPTMTPYD